MIEKLFWFGLGFLTARYLVLNTANYAEIEASKLDQLRGITHDLIKKYAPQADELQISEDVESNIK